MKTAFLILLFIGSTTIFAAQEVLNLTCSDSGREANLKQLHLVTQPSGKMRARVTVANGGSPTEIYSYMVRRLPPTKNENGNVIYRAALGHLELAICTNCPPTKTKRSAFRSTLNIKTPKKAKLFSPNTHLEFKEVACSLVK